MKNKQRSNASNHENPSRFKHLQSDEADYALQPLPAASPATSPSTSGLLLLPNFFNRPVLEIAPELLGKFLVRNHGGKKIFLQIEEVEAYDGPEDKACHASKGKTARTETLFGPPGYFYVYLCYGMHWMLNIVTGPKDYPAAILLRGAGGISGPGRLTKFLHIDQKLNNQKALPESGLWFEDHGMRIEKNLILQTPRIGVDYAGEWSQKPYRFVLAAPRNL